MSKGKEWLKKEIESDGVQLEYLYENYYTDDKAIMIDDVRHLIDQLDEPEITEGKGFLEHLTRLFKKHGYDHLGQVALALENDLEISINKELPVIPQFVADWIRECKINKHNLYGVYHFAPSEVSNWGFNDRTKKERTNLIARAWLDGYAIEQPKLLTVIVKDYDKTIMSKQMTEDEAEKMMREW